MSCGGSLEIIDLKLPGVQMEFGQDDQEPEGAAREGEAPDGPLGTVALF